METIVTIFRPPIHIGIVFSIIHSTTYYKKCQNRIPNIF